MRILLLVEDDPTDAMLVRTFLKSPDEEFRIIHVDRLGTALATLEATAVDVVLLDLRLPDAQGPDGVKAIRNVADTPIVVLTGTDDEKMATDCMNAGAHDYLGKDELKTRNLKRAIGYAISRMREAQLRDRQQTLERYRAMSSATQGTTVTAALAGSGAVSLRSAETFRTIVDEYYGLLNEYRQRTPTVLPHVVRANKERVVGMLGDSGAGPRDLLDAHVAALDRVLAEVGPAPTPLVVESRLLALEMMGLLVDYYRVGHRRRSIPSS